MFLEQNTCLMLNFAENFSEFLLRHKSSDHVNWMWHLQPTHVFRKSCVNNIIDALRSPTACQLFGQHTTTEAAYPNWRIAHARSIGAVSQTLAVVQRWWTSWSTHCHANNQRIFDHSLRCCWACSIRSDPTTSWSASAYDQPMYQSRRSPYASGRSRSKTCDRSDADDWFAGGRDWIERQRVWVQLYTKHETDVWGINFYALRPADSEVLWYWQRRANGRCMFALVCVCVCMFDVDTSGWISELNWCRPEEGLAHEHEC